MKKLYHFAPMILLTILLAVLVVLLEAAIYTTNVLFDSGIYEEAMNEKEVADAIFDEVNTNFGYYTAPTGIPAEVFTSAYTKDELYSASFRLLKDSLSYITDKDAPMPAVSYDFSKIEKSITDYIEKDAEERQIKKDKEYYKMISDTVKLAKDQIETRLDVMMLYKLSGTDFAKKVHNNSGLFNIAVWGLIGAVLIVLIIMVIIDRHHPRDLPYWLGVTLVASAGTVLVPAIYLQATNYFDAFFVRSEYILRTVTGLFDIVLHDIIVFEIVMLCIGVLLIISTQVIHVLYVRSLEKKHKHRLKFEHKTHAAEEPDENYHTPLLTAETNLKSAPDFIESEASDDPAERSHSTVKQATTDEISAIIDEVLKSPNKK